jgi:CRP/FNR family transcriptional regulator, cyclic AMP receptor protein
MNSTSLLEALEHHPFVHAFPRPHIEAMARLAQDVSFERDQIIFREGDDFHQFCLLRSGRVALEIVTQGQALRVQTMTAGDVFSWSAVLMGKGKYFQARALEPTKVLAFEGADLIALCKQDPAFGFEFIYRLLGVVSGRLQATRLQLMDIYGPLAKKAGA